MELDVVGERDPLLKVSLNRGERIFCESDAMVSMEGNLDLTARMQGGLLRSIARRFVNDESIFQQEIVAVRGRGDTLLAPSFPGDIRVLEVGHAQYFLNDGAYLAATDGIDLKIKTQGVGNALFGGTGGFFILQSSGVGQLAICGFGSVFEVPVSRGDVLTIDNKHVIAWDSRLRYNISASTSKSKGLLGNLVNSAISGEGLVTKFEGEGLVYVSSRNKDAMIAEIAKGMASSSE